MPVDATTWMPPDLDADLAQEFADAYPDDPHRAAAEAWEAYAATLTEDAGAPVVSVSTGRQSVTYGPGGASTAAGAMARAAWHRRKARARSVSVGPDRAEWGAFGVPLARTVYSETLDPEDRGIIATEEM